MNLDLTKLRYSEKPILKKQRTSKVLRELGIDTIGGKGKW